MTSSTKDCISTHVDECRSPAGSENGASVGGYWDSEPHPSSPPLPLQLPIHPSPLLMVLHDLLKGVD